MMKWASCARLWQAKAPPAPPAHWPYAFLNEQSQFLTEHSGLDGMPPGRIPVAAGGSAGATNFREAANLCRVTNGLASFFTERSQLLIISLRAVAIRPDGKNRKSVGICRILSDFGEQVAKEPTEPLETSAKRNSDEQSQFLRP